MWFREGKRTGWEIIRRISTNVLDVNVVRYASIADKGSVVSSTDELAEQVPFGCA